MKKLLIVTAIIALAVTGCKSTGPHTTGLVTVDDCNPQLKITSFKDDPFVSVIKYEPVDIENFDYTKVHAVAELSPAHAYKYEIKDKKVEVAFKKLNPTLKYNTNNFREDNYKNTKDGKMVIWSTDTMGVYRLVYVED